MAAGSVADIVREIREVTVETYLSGHAIGAVFVWRRNENNKAETRRIFVPVRKDGSAEIRRGKKSALIRFSPQMRRPCL